LRDRKKLKQRGELIAAAMRLFRDHGFERTRMEDIALAAEVSVATVYNYFPTKQQILLDIVRANALSSQEPSAAILADPPADPLDAFMALMKIETGDIQGDPDKKLWRELLASMIRDQDNRVEIEELRGLFRSNLRRLTRSLVHRGSLGEEVDVEAIVDIAYAIFAYHFRQLVCLDPLSVQQSLRYIRRDLKALLDANGG
jgi:AcrR family transcriptional regulator